MRTHSRLLGAILLLGVASTALGWEILEAGLHRAPPVVLAAASPTPIEIHQPASPRTARLPVPPLPNPKLPGVHMLEARMDGTLVEYTYFRTDIDLDTPAATSDKEDKDAQTGHDKAGPALAFAQGQPRPAPEEIFATVLKDIKPVRTRRIAGMPLAYADLKGEGRLGKPVNVSLSVKQKADPISRVALMPKSDQVLEDALSGLQVPIAECRRLADALATSVLHFGDTFEVILADHDDGKHIVMARLQKASGQDTILARVEDQSFQRIATPALYERLKREATATDEEQEAAQTVSAEPDLADAKAFAPRLVKKMRDAQVPAKIILQVVDLAKKNGFSAANDDDDLMKKIHLVFRERQGKRDLISVAFRTGRGERKFYRYKRDKNSPAEFFDSKGHSVSKFLMANPVPGGRLGDGFAWRIHPILHVRKHHNGVDYDGPMGAPILAAGDGTVVLISWQPGYGRYVRIRHDQGYFTTYAHISRAAKGLTVGQRVTQGQVIAYIGSTGLSTGPHLYYELRKNHRYLDPTSHHLPAGAMLTGDTLKDFHKRADQIEGMSRLIGFSTHSDKGADAG